MPIHDIVTDHKAMTITVGPRVYDRPQLLRVPELHTRVKEEICGAAWDMGVKRVHQRFASILGLKFNRRFQAANYWLWLGTRMTRRAADMLRHDGKHWHQYSDDLVWSAHLALPYVNEAEADGLFHLIPAIVTFRDSPQAIRRMLGQGAWRRVANNSISRNRLIMHATLRARRGKSPPDPAVFARLLDFPSGVLRYVQRGATDDEIIAARISPLKRGEHFMQALHMVDDTRRMVGRAFNPRWSLARMRAEHDRATKDAMRGRYSDRRFADDWCFNADGYSASLLTSPFEIAAEGATQHHCVGSYAHMARDGKCAIFKIDGKERATASLLHDGGWRPDQVYAACNGAVSAECRAFTSRLAAEYSAVLRRAA